MKKIQDLLGNGQVRISAGIDLSFKEFGDGYGAHCSVSFNCNQDDKTVQEATALVKSISQELAVEQLEEARELYEGLRGST